MAYSEGLAQRIRDIVGERPDIQEKKMFGGLAFLLEGKLSVGIDKDRMIIRVNKEDEEGLLKDPDISLFDFTGKPMKGYYYVEAENKEDNELEELIQMSLDFVKSLPAKKRKKK